MRYIQQMCASTRRFVRQEEGGPVSRQSLNSVEDIEVDVVWVASTNKHAVPVS